METTDTMATHHSVIMAMITKFKAEEIAKHRNNKISDEDVIVIRAKYKHYAGHPDFPDCIPIDEEERKNRKRRQKERKKLNRKEKKSNGMGTENEDTSSDENKNLKRNKYPRNEEPTSDGNKNTKINKYLRNDDTTSVGKENMRQTSFPTNEDTTSVRNKVPPRNMGTSEKNAVEGNSARTGNVVTHEKVFSGRDFNTLLVSPVVSVFGKGFNTLPVGPVVSVLGKGLTVKTVGKTVAGNADVTLSSNTPICSDASGNLNRNVNRSTSDVVHYTATITKRPNHGKVFGRDLPLMPPVITATTRSSTTEPYPTTIVCPSTVILPEVTRIAPQRMPINSTGRRSFNATRVPASCSKATVTGLARSNNNTCSSFPITSAAEFRSIGPGVSLVDAERRVLKDVRTHDQVAVDAERRVLKDVRTHDKVAKPVVVVNRQERCPVSSLLPPDNIPPNRSNDTTSTFSRPMECTFIGFDPVSLSTPCSCSSSRGVSTGPLFEGITKGFEEDTYPVHGVQHQPRDEQQSKGVEIEASHLNISPRPHTRPNREDHTADDHLFSIGPSVAPAVHYINGFSALDETGYQVTEGLDETGDQVTEGLDETRDQVTEGLEETGDQVTEGSAETQSKSKKSKPSLPKNSVAIMRSWLFVHRNLPYPSVEEKLIFEELTDLTSRQINDWFVNARRRDLTRIREMEKTNPDHFLETILPQHIRNITIMNASRPKPPEASSSYP